VVRQFSVFLLIGGPLSDRHGRRPVLLTGLIVFTGATTACFVATNIAQLVVPRILQGVAPALPAKSRGLFSG
jgi:DHA1 family bicyclomycin/chloramphenicol resistance-like MFS transporter